MIIFAVGLEKPAIGPLKSIKKQEVPFEVEMVALQLLFVVYNEVHL
jgi:hypothetical protein